MHDQKDGPFLRVLSNNYGKHPTEGMFIFLIPIFNFYTRRMVFN